MAFRAGAEISDIEFVQFHPTSLHVEGAPRFLLSEALRGEGAHLVNSDGKRFMDRYHPLQELAPRDVVARAIVAEMRRTGEPHMYLDLRHLDAQFVRARFPRIYQTCLQYGVDLTTQLAPVHPAAHYAMGGVRTDLDGRTNLGRLFAAGEVACTSVHGANRLASNSLLEGVVFGARTGIAMRECSGNPPPAKPDLPEMLFPLTSESYVRRLAWENCGIIRSGEQMTAACRDLQSYKLVENPDACLEQYEARNIYTVALLIARCALAREESRGAHFRTDFSERRSEFEKHSFVSVETDVSFR
jgi:L-aspartate oxidase